MPAAAFVRLLTCTMLAVTLASPASAQRRRATPVSRAPASIPISNIRYQVTFDSAAAAARTLRLRMSFDAASAGTVLLSLPAWTPGAYEVSNFAANVLDFAPAAGGQALTWDKLDPDTWRIRAAAAGPVTVDYGIIADSLDNAMAWARPDFAFFNGTNVFFFAEGRDLRFPATVSVATQAGWKVRTSMHRVGPGEVFRETNYHDLVDMPFFVGRFDDDSAQVAGKWQWLATYPAGALAGPARAGVWDALRRMTPAEIAVTGVQPWDHYVTFMVFQPYPGGSALEHQSSHLGIYTPQLIGTPILASITAHEMFHAWNVKRLRPAEMVPYNYEHWQPTTLLWVSEGITDYYADLALVRGGIEDSAAFLQQTQGKMQTVDAALPVALEDASLSTWVHPKDGTGYLYYPKGSLAGFMLDIMIRDASDNRHGLDDVIRDLYRTTWLKGRGFTTAEFYGSVGRMGNGLALEDFHRRYVDGREPLPWGTVLPLAGLHLKTDSTQVARIGVATQRDSTGEHVMQVAPGSMAADAGIEAGDLLLSVGGVATDSANWADTYRSRYGSASGTSVPIIVRRGTAQRTLAGTVRLAWVVTTTLEPDPNASPKARRVLHGILTGTVTGSQ